MTAVTYSPTGWAALYDVDGEVVARPVEQWGENSGEALVVSVERLALVPATILPGFRTLTRVGRVVAAIPAGPGWKLRTRDVDDGQQTFSVDPIIGWIVDDQGGTRPVAAEFGAAWAGPVTDCRIMTPDERQED